MLTNKLSGKLCNSYIIVVDRYCDEIRRNIGDNFEMSMTVLAVLITNTLYFLI